MKKYQAWAIADIGMLGVSGLAGWLAGSMSANIFAMPVAIFLGLLVFLALDQLLCFWYYSGTSPREKFYHGDDEH